MFKRFLHRSYELEHLDKGDYTADEYEECLSELRFINRFLGDRKALHNSLIEDVKRKNLKTFTVLDVGAGSGYLLRVIAEWARKNSRKVMLVGLEINERATRAILEESASYAEIKAIRADALKLPFRNRAFDYVICSLFIHHFREQEIVKIFNEMARVASEKIIVIDLERHWLAYYLYLVFSRVFLKNRLVREDGALSIRRGFLKTELEKLAEQVNLKQVEVRTFFPFRLVLIAEKK
jgi:ubiquinone/menaquinone biosynthesis C-methylase UbiE